eukprot:2247322-Pyramimonas_sp.AAC.1
MPTLSVIKKAGAVVSRFARPALPSAMQYGVGVHGAPPTPCPAYVKRHERYVVHAWVHHLGLDFLVCSGFQRR